MEHSNDETFGGLLWDELKWRGLISTTTNDELLKNALNDETITFYCGFDPTAPSLHLGNLAQVITMKRLQLHGHKALALVGGSTGMIGDPRPTAERNLQTKETVTEWVNKLQKQLGVFLNLDGTAGKLVNNLDWTENLNVLDFLREIGKHFRIGTMLKKDAVVSRMESDEGISFTEFSYQLLQGMDFLELFKRENCTLQIGGTDQWGNILNGVDLVGKSVHEKVHGLTTPLLTNSDGTKFGKSEGNAIWLDAEMCSPFEMFQFWLNTADVDVIARLKEFTFLSREQINSLEISTLEEPFKRLAQKELAVAVTSLVHGEVATEAAKIASEILFKKPEEMSGIDGSVLRQAAMFLNPVELIVGETLESAFVRSGVTASLSDTRRLAKQNGLVVNMTKVTVQMLSELVVEPLQGDVVILRKGKKGVAALIV